MNKKMRPKSVREWQRRRTAEWRKKHYEKGLTYRPGKDGNWQWYPRIKPRKSDKKSES